MKRLRKYFSNIQIRFLACGEYGGQTNRPHYHALLFGIDFLDKTAFSRSRAGYVNYVSATLAKLWPFGHHTINGVSINSCGYVARYVTKNYFIRLEFCRLSKSMADTIKYSLNFV